MPKYHIWTIGCQMNKAESDRLGSLFEQQGYQATVTAEEADLIVLNSCVVRQSAENRAVGKLRALKPLKQANPNLTVALTGCLVDSNEAQLRKAFPYVDHFFKPGEIPRWLQGTQTTRQTHSTSSGQAQETQDSPVSAYLPIIQGCDNFCSYCIVPYRRGRERSRPVAELVQEARELVKHGASEITLVGQNVDSYGHDLADKPELADLLEEFNGIEGLARLRFLTNHPKDMTERLIEAVASLDKVCEQFYVPVQSGDNDILKLMRRDYTVERYRQLIDEIRHQVPDAAISTDVIVGFPSETEAQFQHTYDLLAELRFDTVHVAAYSPRAGTIAARELEDDVPAAEKSRRLALIEKLQTDIASEINARLLRKTVEILVEGRKKGKWQGRTRSGKLVFFSDSGNWRGQLVKIRIEKTSPWSLQGKIIEETTK
ncbi:MAG: tRNA (N6-isopentenyl adenosine(37)-C2)-methylthiotransferase MiaB [Chloroflexi bacterium]|nr:tRNA (N6-isopentenyl adenosine(37)-C2)-methylthiotransferase MiaB [Chloroflexota bacterium]